MPAELATSLIATEAERLMQAEGLVRGFCGWHIAPSRTVTAAKIRGSGDTTLLLPSLYVTAVSDVVDDEAALTVEDDYIWSAAGVLTRAGYWTAALVTVTYTHGYATVPPEVTAVVQAVAQRAVDNPKSLTRKTVGPFTDAYSATAPGQVGTLALLESEKAILSRYALPARP